LYRRLDGPQSRSGRVRRASPIAGFDPRAVQSVVSVCTDCALRVVLPVTLVAAYACDTK
jgi:hypothetical protein